MYELARIPFVEQCRRLHEAILKKHPLKCYRFRLVEVYNVWAQILSEKEAFPEAIQIIDQAVVLEQQDKNAVDYYLTCYHAGLFRMLAYDSSPAPALLTDGLRFAEEARANALHCLDSANAQRILRTLISLLENWRREKTRWTSGLDTP